MKYLRSHLFLVAIIALAVIAIAASVALVIYKDSFVVSNQANNNTTVADSIVKKEDKPTNEAPEKFPTNVPIEDGAKIIQNFNATTPDGRFQATRVFVSQKSTADNLKIYQTYLKDNGYTVQAPVEVANYTSILGIKGKTQLQISIDENSSTKVRTVNISLTELAR